MRELVSAGKRGIMGTRRIAVAMSVVIALAVAWVAIGIGASFQEAPPTTGAYDLPLDSSDGTSDSSVTIAPSFHLWEE